MRIIAETEEERNEIQAVLEFLRNFKMVRSLRGRRSIFYESSTHTHPWIGEEIEKGSIIPLFYNDKLEELKNCRVEVQK